MKKKNIIILTIFVMCLISTSTAHAVPIYNFNVVENISANIIGGNNNDLIVEYNSEDIDVIYSFKITSLYPYLNNTPEIRYAHVVVDDTALSCTNETVLNDTVFATYCSHHLSASHHNTTVSFQFATNIMPSDYAFEFAILHAASDKPIILYRSSGGSSYTYPNINKTYAIKVIRNWIKPLELVDDIDKYIDTNDTDKYNDTDDVEYVNDTTASDDTPSGSTVNHVEPDDDDYNIYLIIFCVIMCILIFIQLLKKTKKGDDA